MRLLKMLSLLLCVTMMDSCTVLDGVRALDVSPSEFDNVDADGAILTFAVETSVSWTVECAMDWITADPSSGLGSEPVFLKVGPNSTMRQRIGVVTVTSGLSKKTLIITQAAAQTVPNPDPVPDQDPTPTPEADPTNKKWMELPAMNSSDLSYFYHSFTINGNTYRNYSFGWDDTNKVAFWVAYPLCSFYTDSFNGKDNRYEEYFIKDPLLGNASPYPDTHYAGDYDRGHQIPSADRQCSELANGQTFYGTNMTAQSNSLNGGPWAALEKAIRDYANSLSRSDTTYVVTGCYVADSNEWETDTDGMRIKVPSAYFKAVLVLEGGNWTGGAYWTPHVGYSKKYADWAISISELESKTGLNFYPNLSDKIGATQVSAIKAAKPGDLRWWK